MTAPLSRCTQDSGVSWIGDIPTDWSVLKFRHVFRESVEKIEDEVVGQMLSVSGYRGIEIKEYDDDNRRRLDDEVVGYRIVRRGQLVVNTMWLNYAGLGVSNFEGHVSPAYRSYDFRSDISRRYIHHLMRSAVYVQGYTRLLTGIRPNSLQMSREDLMNFPILLPPSDEQTAIAAFLDRETSKIDALVEEQQRLIELLKEKRQAVISHAVTKGLDPDVRMKDSGVEWLGEVPEHWDRVQLGRLCRQVSDGPHFSPSYVEDGVMFLSARNIKVDGWSLGDAKFIAEGDYAEFCRRVTPERGDVLYTKGGTTGIAKVVDLDDRFQVWVHVAVLKIDMELADSYYIAFALNSHGCYEQSQLYTQGATNKDLGLTRMVKIWMALPPRTEQREIVSYLHRKTTELDKLIREAEQSVDLLNERRTALISAAVTGKIDVPGTMAPAPIVLDQRRVRPLIAAEIIDKLAHKKTFGRVKLQKIVYLAEVEAGISELDGSYMREAAGPLDRDMIADMEAELQRLGHVTVEQLEGRGGAVTYKVAGSVGAYRSEASAILGARATRLSQIIAALGDMHTRSAEAVATLYAVWNDALLDGQSPSDEAIVSETLNSWHPEKAEKFKAQELHTWLAWMRRNGFVPRGQGPRTMMGRHFA